MADDLKKEVPQGPVNVMADPKPVLTPKQRLLDAIKNRSKYATLLVLGIKNPNQAATEFIIDQGQDIDYKASYIERAYGDDLTLLAMNTISISGFMLTNAISFCGTEEEQYVQFDQTGQLFMTFGQALDMLSVGRRVTRMGWNGKNQWVKAQYPDEKSKMGAPYLYLSNAQGVLVPWVPSQGDLFGGDWLLVEETRVEQPKRPMSAR